MKAAYYSIENPIHGVLIGTAVGDSLGLPAEGLSPERIKANGWSQWRHRLLFGKGMISDDTEHTLFVAQALLQYPNDVDDFRSALAWKLKWWLMSLPAGVGLATARAMLKLWIGVPVSRSGVWSAGNGPAMRSSIIGVRYCNDTDTMHTYVKASTLLTHTDPRALTGALAVAEISAYAATGNDPSDKL
ncbi:MAG: ADP-ribosylglycohydrolase family protein [Pontiellaceae bacterium]|nr:ADP-ribosylglycohydrolase family protein [Pontiellaceae bacterium]MBN2784287.1 ADP-ribosylglycohydrolase family protein [Pontiellaceae bacterium]